jgi:hypothetical protein
VGGLYPLPLDEIKQVCSAARSSILTWHNHLGHTSNRIVEQVASNNNILCSSEPVKHSMCDAC